MDTGRKLPRNANYMEHLPLAIPATAKRRNYFPVNGQSFTSTGNNIIRIDISGDSFLDTKTSYLSFRFNNTTGQACGFDFGNGYSFIRRLRIEQAGNVLTDTNSYGRLMSSILLPCQGDRDNLKSRSITENARFNNDKANGNATAATPAADLSGASVTTPAHGAGLIVNNAVAPPGVPTAGSTATFTIPLVNGILGVNQDKMVPLQLLGSSPITIEIELAPALDIGVFAGVPVAYTIDTVRYVASLVETPPMVDEQLRLVQAESGGAIMLSGIDYTHFQGTISAAATGQQNINVPARRRSIKSILWAGASQTFVAGGALAQDLRYNLSFGGNFNMTEYSVRVGSVQYPAEPVQCNYGLAAGPAGVRSEHVTELEKCFGTLGSTVGLGSLCASNFATVDCDVQRMTTVVAPGAADATHIFCPFGIDMESFQRVTAGHDGVNTADRATPITLQLTIGAAAVEAVTIDAYVVYDSLFYIDSSGSIRVSF
jgi:hypothetical protein